MFSPVYCWARGRCGESFLELEQCGEDLVQSPGQDDGDDDDDDVDNDDNDDDEDDDDELKRCSTCCSVLSW